MQKKHHAKMPSTQKELALFWRVSVRTLHRMRTGKSPAPVSDPSAMIDWYSRLAAPVQIRLGKAFVARLAALRTELRGQTIDPDYAAFKRDRVGKPSQDTNTIAELKRLRDYAIHKTDRATSAGDFAALNEATALLKHFSAIIHDEEIRAQRLGRETGDILPRAQADAIASALGFWLMRSADDLIAELQSKLVAASASGPLGYEQIRTVIEPSVLTLRVLTPFARSAQADTGVSLPKWLIDAMASSMGDVLEDGAKAFLKLYAEPVPKSA